VTEAEWLACTDPQKMQAFLRGKASARKLRQFILGCYRRHWFFRHNEGSQAAVEVLERHADNLASPEEVKRARRGPEMDWLRFKDTIRAAIRVTDKVANHSHLGRSYATEREAHCRLLRDIFGNPFRPLAGINSGWLSPTVANLASVAYQERGFPSGELDPARHASAARDGEQAKGRDHMRRFPVLSWIYCARFEQMAAGRECTPNRTPRRPRFGVHLGAEGRPALPQQLPRP
jgi:hypothetical protein